MLWKASLVWVAGLVTVVPFGTYYLLFHAERDQYAFLLTFVLFWIFGYWSVVGPLIAAIKVRRVFRAVEQVRTKDELLQILRSDDGRQTAIELIASENHIPRFLAAFVYRLLMRRMSTETTAPPPSEQGGVTPR